MSILEAILLGRCCRTRRPFWSLPRHSGTPQTRNTAKKPNLS
jgi:hypothetical protein